MELKYAEDVIPAEELCPSNCDYCEGVHGKCRYNLVDADGNIVRYCHSED